MKPWTRRAPSSINTGSRRSTGGCRPASARPLTAPAAETLRGIWKRWLGNKLLDEFSRVDAIKGQTRGKGRRTMTAASGRRPVVADALAACPVGRWVCFDDFGQFMQAAGFDFAVNRDPWNLYIAEPDYGSLGYDGSHDWAILEGRYVLCLLFEYAATLGLIDLAYTDPRDARPDFTHMWGADDLTYLSRYDGLHYFRLNSLGAYCLDVADAYAPSTPPARAALTIYPDLSVQAAAQLSPDERALLETYAAAETDGVWRLDRDKALAAIESGHDPDEFRKFLAARDDQPLPETVEGFLGAAKRGAHALKIRQTALLIDCADAETAARLTTDKRTASLCLRAGERLLAVPATLRGSVSQGRPRDGLRPAAAVMMQAAGLTPPTRAAGGDDACPVAYGSAKVTSMLLPVGASSSGA